MSSAPSFLAKRAASNAAFWEWAEAVTPQTIFL
jgi:hypothetical protein